METMQDEKGHNGWKNYETWSVALILDNDQDLQETARLTVQDAVERGAGSTFWSEEERKRFRAADALKEWVERSAEITLEISDDDPMSYLWSQLVSAALSDVDWNAVADHYLNS